MRFHCNYLQIFKLTTGQRRRGRGGGTSNSGRYGQNLGVVNRTLQVRKIPAELNNIAKLNEHFGQFGQIVNMQVKNVRRIPSSKLILNIIRHF